MIKVIENMKTPHFHDFEKMGIFRGSIKLKRAYGPPTFLYIFSNQLTQILEKIQLFEFPICNKKSRFSGVFNILKGCHCLTVYQAKRKKVPDEGCRKRKRSFTKLIGMIFVALKCEMKLLLYGINEKQNHSTISDKIHINFNHAL